MADFGTKTGIAGTPIANVYDATPALTDRVPITGGRETAIQDIVDTAIALMDVDTGAMTEVLGRTGTATRTVRTLAEFATDMAADDAAMDTIHAEMQAREVEAPIELTAADVDYYQVIDNLGVASLITPAISMDAMLAAPGVPAAIGDTATWTRGGSSYARTVQDTFKELPCILDWIDPQYHADILNYTSAVDVTSRLSLAHSEAKVPIYYPAGIYKITKFTIPSGGIIGAGKQTILDCTDTTADDCITYTGVDDTSLLVNEIGARFENFTLRCNTAAQKSDGFGIKINPGTLVDNIHSNVLNVTIRNFISGLSLINSSFVHVEKCTFSFYSTYGIYEEMNVVAFEDSGDNLFLGNQFFTDQANAIGIRYRGGGARIVSNKMNGGLIGIDLLTLRSSSVIQISNNSLENQTNNCIRLTTDETTVATAFTQVMITDNQLNGNSCASATVQIGPYEYILNSLVISDNMIQHYNAGSSAIDINNSDKIVVTDNHIFGNGTGLYGIKLRSGVLTGRIANNAVFGMTEVISSDVTTVSINQTIGKEVGAYDPPSLTTGTGDTVIPFQIVGAKLGDTVTSSFSLNLQGVTLTAYVYDNTGLIAFRFQNGTAGTIDLGSGVLSAVVVRT